jgi:hypothetical protein
MKEEINMTLVVTLERTALTSVDDSIGRWQIEGGALMLVGH